MNTSLDQTTRIHGPIPSLHNEGRTQIWHELARPQVHGYDIVGVQFLDALRFVSIADEKVIRVFEAPREFVEVVKNLGVAELESSAFEVSSSWYFRSYFCPEHGCFVLHEIGKTSCGYGTSSRAVEQGYERRYAFDRRIYVLTLINPK